MLQLKDCLAHFKSDFHVGECFWLFDEFQIFDDLFTNFQVIANTTSFSGTTVTFTNISGR
jgi:hypothetical protein